MGYGPWLSTVEVLRKGGEWSSEPWEAVSAESLKRTHPGLGEEISGKSEKVRTGDPVLGAEVLCASSTDLHLLGDGAIDLVITDPPFGDLLHYSELADFFYEPEDPDGFYQRLLTQCWREAHRVLKPSGILAFTFHHSEDEPWVAVLESLFDAGYYLEATYPIRSDETKGEGEFGSKTIEYDIIHVCRKRTEEPKPVSWGRMRREVMADVRQLQAMLENHAKGGFPCSRHPGDPARQGAGIFLSPLRQGLRRRGASHFGEGCTGRHQPAHR
jgi:putative DNA methylase